MTFEKIVNWILAGIVIGLPTYALLSTSLGTMSRLNALMLCAPLGVMVSILSRFHLSLLLFFCAFAVAVPIIGERPIPVFVMVQFLVFAGYVIRSAMGKSLSSRGCNRVIDFAMLATSIAIVSWIAIGRPRMGSLGAETGGAWEAMMASSGVAAYWGTRSLKNQPYSSRNLVLVTLFGSVAGLIWNGVSAKIDGGSSFDVIAAWFFSSGWWFYALVLGMATKVWHHPKRAFSAWPSYLVSLLLVLHSLMSGFRSRIVFAPIMVGVAFWCGKFRKSMLLFIVVFVSFVITLANTNVGTELPWQVRRVLSPLRMESNVSDLWAETTFGEFGIQSPWRVSLWEIAWPKIREKPVLGNGFAIVDFNSAFTENLQQAGMQGVAMAGQFHCMPVNLMYFLGIPIACLFCLAWIILFIRLFYLAFETKGWSGAFVVSLLVFLIAETGQALTTGLGVDFAKICIVMGVYQAIAPGLSASSLVAQASRLNKEKSAQ